MIGLIGDDTYGVYSQLDTVIEQANEGNDRVLTFAGYALTAGASVETLSTAINSGTDPIQLTGNEISQFIIGNFGANTIDGRGGGDAMIGLGGNDVYYVSGRTDFVIETANGGNDVVYARGDFVLNAGSSVETIAVATSARNVALSIGGNELAQSISGGNGADTLNGGGGADTLIGGLGDDTYRLFGGETVIEDFGGGYDRVFTGGSFALPEQTARQVPSVEFISTAVNADTEAINLAGSLVAQTMIGNYGNNVIDGRGGHDTLIGLRGDDGYRVYGYGEAVIENAGEGSDTVFASSNYTLNAGASVETLSPANNGVRGFINLTGNEFAQTIIGDFGDNVLDGGGGNDTLLGLQGNDVFRLTTAPGTGNIITLADFGNGADRIRLDLNRFAGLTSGALASTAIAIGAAAADADDRIIYNAATGALSFDSDGIGSAAAIQFAILPTGLSATQIVVDVANIINPTGVVTLAEGGPAYLVGGATGAGVDLAATYPSATSFVIGTGGLGAPTDVVFGPNSIGVPVTFSSSRSVGAFDFSQLATGLRLTPSTDFATTAGQTIIAYPPVSGSSGAVGPSAVTATAFDDYIDASRRAAEGSSPGDLRFGPTLYGGAGNDTLIGGYRMDGGAGDDLLVSSLNGIMVGGAGADTFRIGVDTRYLGQQRAPNTLLDFNPAEDRIELIKSSSATSLTTLLTPGALPANQFTTDATAYSPGMETLFYDRMTGDLSFYSYLGNGPAFRVIAQLPTDLDLTAANFTVVGP
ncbi:Ca2+-binding RTX toxin-like protein [Sphingomonas jinjuensis]|uniref:Ca2+-binding RTX toxin-like protein n=1 Tax=Sphingomonas jinjuensis TaxID=535907 RepID=A0A840F9G5_9SPHN|nr:Ca2+-binding RTX toxin-like protein [Sphingomonas jinjuensis]